MKRYKNGSDLFITEYFSVGEFIADINSLPNNKFFQNREPSSQRKESHDNGWSASRDYARATYLINHGWDYAAEKMAAKVKMTNGVSSTVRYSKPAYGVVGFQASVPRYLQGIPTNMVSRQTVYTKQKIVTITKDISYSARWSSDSIIRESIKALQIIQSMENGGQRVRLNVMLASSNGDKHCICKVCVKQPDERMNISKMAFALAHPAMLRRFFFKWIETDPFTDFDLGCGYGTPSSLPIKERAMSENEYYIPEEIKDMDTLIEQLKSGKPRKSLENSR